MAGEDAVPEAAVVEVFSEPSSELLQQYPAALAALLRMALLGGMELTLPTALHLLLDVCQTVVPADRQLVVFMGGREGQGRMQLGRHFNPPDLPDPAANLLHGWTQRSAKPLLVKPGLHPAMDQYLARLEVHTGLSVPLFLEHDLAGAIQLYRTAQREFTAADGQLIWILSLLAEHQLMRIQLLQQLTRMAYTDFLTGLRTRGYFEQALETEVRRALRKSNSCGLLLLDLDDFKSVNDRFGHHAGDEVLRQVARLLTRDMREIDTVARFGGDEFSIILPETDDEGARFVATRIRDAIRHHALRIPESGQSVTLNVSIGIALCPTDERNPEQLLRAADVALYQAKRQGNDRPLFWRELRRTS